MKNLLMLILLMVLVSCKQNKDNKIESQSIGLKQLQSSIDSLFNAKIGAEGPGAAIAVSYGQEMIFGKGYGLRDIAGKEPVTLRTNMRMASVSKQFTALCILSLVDNNVLSLQDTITKFWNYPVFEDITVEQLLNHTSGIADYESPYFLESWDRSKIVENKDILKWLETNPEPLFEPGKGWEYSNTAYLVLALLVEKVSGQEFSAYAKENVFSKAGMERTNYYNLAHPIDIPERAYCYEKDSLGNWEKVDGYFMNGILGDGAVYTNIMDYLAYDRALRSNVILSNDLHERIFKPSSQITGDWPATGHEMIDLYPFNQGKKFGYGMGWIVTDDLAMHRGSWNGTRTMVVRKLDEPLTILLFMNSNSELRELLIIELYNLVDKYLKTTAGKDNES
ncbi:serine hydrolase [Robiginitalea sp. SC105]|uniref:serine hydrolase domain-containing protein n=1 Tax=Robiginitalea sp. SC105 TaxID=2762332 RepID=UPI00163B54ED|nr:serine hydrolase domain-containing protein [Robiginitalea sp. SC105]MBC2838151.1 beta-lactamase family protein [Robiginitalea sp. SC105]